MNRRKFLKLTATTVTGSLSVAAANVFAVEATPQAPSHLRVIGGPIGPIGTIWNLTPAQAGDYTQVQTVINNAADGDTIQFPPGSFTWTGTVNTSLNLLYPDGSVKGKSINFFGDPTSRTTIYNSIPYAPSGNNTFMIGIHSSPNFTVEIKNIDFIESPTISAGSGRGYLTFQIYGSFGTASQPANWGQAFLVHDCTFQSMVADNINKMVDVGQSCRAVFWNCTWHGTGVVDLDGVEVQNGADTYPVLSTMGTLDTDGMHNLYFEDCTFNNIAGGYALDISDGAKVVVRYCTFNDSAIGSHGQDTAAYGYRHAEIYNNTFNLTAGNPAQVGACFSSRGGTFVFFNNVISANFSSSNVSALNFQVQAVSRAGTVLNCPTQYPVARQCGQGWNGASPAYASYSAWLAAGGTSGSYSYPQYAADGGGYVPDPNYIWGNTGPLNIYFADITPDECGNRLTTAQFVQLNRDYFLSPKPNYTPYTYPHPLRATS